MNDSDKGSAAGLLADLAGSLASGDVRVIDLTHSSQI